MLSSDRWTGPAEPVCQIVEGLRARGHEVGLAIVPGRSLESRAEERGLSPAQDLALSRSNSPLSFWSQTKQFAAHVRAHGVQIAHCHMSHDHVLAGLTARFRRLPVKVVRTHHAIRRDGHAPGGDWFWRRTTDAGILVGECQRPPGSRLARLDNVHLIPGAVDTETFHPDVSGAAVREALDIPPDAPAVGMIAHFKAGRGWSTSVPAMIEVQRRHPETHFILAGGHSSLVKRIRAKFREVGAFDRVHILTDRRFEWPEVLAAMDLSLWLAPGADGAGRAMLEVMATGRPVIAGDIGPGPETVEDGVSGLVAPLGVDPSALAESISALIRDPERRRAMGEAARVRVMERHTLGGQLDRLESLYRSLLA